MKDIAKNVRNYHKQFRSKKHAITVILKRKPRNLLVVIVGQNTAWIVTKKNRCKGNDANKNIIQTKSIVTNCYLQQLFERKKRHIRLKLELKIDAVGIARKSNLWNDSDITTVNVVSVSVTNR